MTNTKTKLIFVSVFILVLFILIPKFFITEKIDTVSNGLASFIYNEKTIQLEIAKTEEEKVKGLSGRNFLEKNKGLLFVYDDLDFYGIWMKEMNFPIDIIWLDQNFKVVEIADNVSPNTFPKVFYPSNEAKYIIELNAGISKEIDLNVGSVINIKY